VATKTLRHEGEQVNLAFLSVLGAFASPREARYAEIAVSPKPPIPP